MADNYVWIGVDDAEWEDADNWNPDGAGTDWPGQTDPADTVVVDGTSGKPAAPVADTTIASIAVDTVLVTGGLVGDYNLIVTGNATFTNGGRLRYATVQGNVTVDDESALDASKLQIQGDISFTGDTGLLTGSAPGADFNIASTGPLKVVAVNSAIEIGGDITAGGGVGMMGKVGSPSYTLTFTSCTITGPGTAGSVLCIIDADNSPDTVTGFEPLYTIDGGAAQSAYGSGSPIDLPAEADVRTGTTYGDANNQQLGELVAGGGGMIVIGSRDLL